MARREKPGEPRDDGRTIANMNVDGMPWYTPQREDLPPDGDGQDHYRMSSDERRAYTWAAVRAGLLILAVFAAAFGGFLWFCTAVWFQ